VRGIEARQRMLGVGEASSAALRPTENEITSARFEVRRGLVVTDVPGRHLCFQPGVKTNGRCVTSEKKADLEVHQEAEWTS